MKGSVASLISYFTCERTDVVKEAKDSEREAKKLTFNISNILNKAYKWQKLSSPPKCKIFTVHFVFATQEFHFLMPFGGTSTGNM